MTPEESLALVSRQKYARDRRVDAALAALPDGHVIRTASATWTKTAIQGGGVFWINESGRIGLIGSQLLSELGAKVIQKHIGEIPLRW